ncbi:MAG: MBL fold metallo-hydrolase [Oscillospiraceae bacterium]|nr:MBL fold metallo-hydrolase [Oscillospiraceae bacterium]
MKITYLRHSGFLAELPQSNWIFDDISGKLPAFDRKKPLYVCVSHNHSDHYDKGIFARFSGCANVKFLLDSGVDAAGQAHIVPVRPDGEYRLNGAVVRTLGSTDTGVAFVVEADGCRLYHAGDLHWWAWPDDTPDEAQDMKMRFFAELDKIRGQRFDAAFVPLDSRLEENFALGFDAAARAIDAGALFPMHMWEDYAVIARLKALACAAPYADRVQTITRQNQAFCLTKGEVENEI